MRKAFEDRRPCRSGDCVADCFSVDAPIMDSLSGRKSAANADEGMACCGGRDRGVDLASEFRIVSPVPLTPFIATTSRTVRCGQSNQCRLGSCVRTQCAVAVDILECEILFCLLAGCNNYRIDVAGSHAVDPKISSQAWPKSSPRADLRNKRPRHPTCAHV